ncbi:dTMP kinase [Kerstersia sp.]|uniref:dTMP kinase n=1 Tax=Kerstersia sp. TaxID=1930783 RepID=UPI003F916C9D
MVARQGYFITLEGVDGAGKSSHIASIADCLRQHAPALVVTREPGGTPAGEQLRDMLLHQAMHQDTELLLMFAARCEHLRTVISPALARGDWVLCDRFTDATYAYQGGGRGLDDARIGELEQWVQLGTQPDLTLLFDVPLEVARARRSSAREPDRFEAQAEAFFERTRQAYLRRAAAAPGRIRIIDASRSMEEVGASVVAVLTERLQSWQ